MAKDKNEAAPEAAQVIDDAPAGEHARVYLGLDALVRAECRRLQDPGFRAYQVRENDGRSAYVVTNSPANAALAVVEVERVATKALLGAALEAIGGKAGGQ